MYSACDVHVDILNGVICLEDKNLGNVSVTNDIENVVKDCRDYGFLTYGYPIIYRDSEGQWTGVVILGTAFHSFKHFPQNLSKEAAVNHALELRKTGEL